MKNIEMPNSVFEVYWERRTAKQKQCTTEVKAKGLKGHPIKLVQDVPDNCVFNNSFHKQAPAKKIDGNLKFKICCFLFWRYLQEEWNSRIGTI